MRVLIIWGESLAKPGGGTAHCLGLAGGLVAGGHQVTIVTPCYAGQELDPGGLDVRPVALARRGIVSFLYFQALSVLLLPLWLVRHRPSGVYVRTCFLQGIMAMICRAAGVPLVGEVDSMVDQEILMRGEPAWAASLARGLDRINNRLTSALVCVSRGLREESIRRGASPATTFAIPNGARTDLMRPGDRLAARKKLHLPEDEVIIGFAGTFVTWQGLDFLVAAARELKDRPDTRLKLALMGAGQLEPQLRQWVQDGGLEGLFIFLPPVPQHQVAEFLTACDAAVVPIHDPRKLRYGLSVLKFWDAVSAGLPVFVPKGSELNETLADLKLPGVFDPADPASLAEAMLSFAPQVETHRNRREEVHRVVVERYSWARVAKQVATVIERLAPGGRARP